MDVPGRPALFATTEEFLRRFGVGSTKELPEPAPGRIDEFRMEAEEELKFVCVDLIFHVGYKKLQENTEI